MPSATLSSWRHVLPFFSAAVALKPAAVSCQSNTSQRNIVVGALSCEILYLRTQ